jgi:hypothetical protein
MNSRDNQAKIELERLLEALQNSILEASNSQVSSELAAMGVNSTKSAELMKFAGEHVINEHYRAIRERLARERQQLIAATKLTCSSLPQSRAEKLDLLSKIVATHSSNLRPMTAQFRELKNPDLLSDSEITSMLKDLIALGFCAKAQPKGC